MKKKALGKAIANTAGLIISAFALFPLLWMFIGGFKSDAEVLSTPFRFFPHKWDLGNYAVLFKDIAFARTIVVTLAGGLLFAVLVLIVNSMMAYVFARIDFPFKGFLWAYVIMTMFIPGIAI